MSLSGTPSDGGAAVGAGFFKEIILELVGVDEEVAGTVFFKEIIFEEDGVVETEVTFEVAIKAAF